MGNIASAGNIAGYTAYNAQSEPLIYVTEGLQKLLCNVHKCDLICENRPLPAFWRSRVITAVLVPRHLGTRRKILKAIGLTLVEIYSKVLVVLDKYFSQKMPCERVAKVCMSISVFVRVY